MKGRRKIMQANLNNMEAQISVIKKIERCQCIVSKPEYFRCVGGLRPSFERTIL